MLSVDRDKGKETRKDLVAGEGKVWGQLTPANSTVTDVEKAKHKLLVKNEEDVNLSVSIVIL